MKEEFASIVEIRQGRSIYLRKVILDGNLTVKDVAVTTTTTTTITESPTTNIPNLQIIFVHGICGTEQQFQLLLQSINDQLLKMVEKSSSASSSSASSSSSAAAGAATTASPRITIVCWLYDQVGCGQSPILPNYSDYAYEETQADLKALLLAEQNHTNHFPTPSSTLPTIVVGHSYGPCLFIPLLSDPNILPNLMGLILINTSVRCPQLPLADGGHVIMRLPTFILQCIQSQLTEGFIAMAVHPNHTELRDIIRTASQKNTMFVAKYYHRNSKWMTLLQLQQAVGGSRNDPAVPVPTLIIHGTHDGVTPIECGQYMYNQCLSVVRDDDDDKKKNPSKGSFPPVTFIAIDEASHMVMIEQPHQTAHTIVQFINSLLQLQQ